MRGVLVDPLAQVLLDCTRPPLAFVRTIEVGGLSVELSDQAVDSYFILEGYPTVLSGAAFIPNATVEEIANIVDFGNAVEVGHSLMFFGNCNVREIRS